MEIARALTRRIARPVHTDDLDTVDSKPKRPVISLPMGLISTTNSSVHDNPTISPAQILAVQKRQISSSSSNASLNESSFTGPDTPGMTDTSSVESHSPVSHSPIEPNHLTQYFGGISRPNIKSEAPPAIPAELRPEQRSEPVHEAQPAPEPAIEAVSEKPNYSWTSENFSAAAPALPKRAPSHSKQEHERLSRMRSFRSSSVGGLSKNGSLHGSYGKGSISEEVGLVDQIAPIPPLKSSSRPTSIRAPTPSLDAQDAFSPFSQELLQLQEVAQEFASYASPITPDQRSSSELRREAVEAEEDRRVMEEKGLKAFRASDYRQDIEMFSNDLWDLDEEEDEDRGEDEDEDLFYDADDTIDPNKAVPVWL